MTSSELKQLVENAGRESFFFARSTMKFFGDTMRNYGARETTIRTRSGKVPVYELYRRRPVKHGLFDSAYFNRSTLEREFEVQSSKSSA